MSYTVLAELEEQILAFWNGEDQDSDALPAQGLRTNDFAYFTTMLPQDLNLTHNRG
jgi:hypothetical protein